LNDFVIGFRSTDEPYKGLDSVFNAIKSKKWVDTTLLSVQNKGNSFLEANGVKLCELGWIDHDALVDFYNAVDVFLMPSSYETFGFMCVESMSCGKPVIVSRTTPMSDHINYDQAGISLESMDPASIISALDLLRGNPEYKESLGARGRELVLERFKVETYVSNLLALYHKTIVEFSNE
jgi:glycosyltransferase involved in cell wall biosynthesis